MSTPAPAFHGKQLSLLAENSETELEAWLQEQERDRELRWFVECLTEAGVSDGTIYAHKGHLRATVRASGAPGAAWLVSHPAEAARAIRLQPQRGSRQGRLRALELFAQFHLGETGAGEFVSSLEQELPRRLRPRDGFLGIDVGGSSKLVRRRVPFLYDDGLRLLGTAKEVARADCASRDVALAAMHVRSTLRSQDILALDWDSVVTLLEDVTADEIGRLNIVVDGRAVPSAVMPEAREALRVLWDSRRRPRADAVFVSARQPRARLSRDYAGQLLSEAATEAGFTGLDRRWMRAPLVFHLRRVRGWGRLELRDACGLKAVKEVERMLRFMEELTAQMRATEATFLPELPTREAAPRDQNVGGNHPVPRGIAEGVGS